MARPIDPVSVAKPDGDATQIAGIERRRFVKAVGGVVLAVQILPLLGYAPNSALRLGHRATDDLVVHSSEGAFRHVHNLVIPEALITTPPRNGVALRSTTALWHRHEIALTRVELVAVGQGRTVTKKSSSHLFVIALAARGS